MSDVLVHSKEKTLLLTGLTNVQIIRTARDGRSCGHTCWCGASGRDGSDPDGRSKGIPIMVTCLPMFESCGILYKRGIKGCSELVTAGGC
jgi:hypothetical protein